MFAVPIIQMRLFQNIIHQKSQTMFSPTTIIIRTNISQHLLGTRNPIIQYRKLSAQVWTTYSSHVPETEMTCIFRFLILSRKKYNLSIRKQRMPTGSTTPLGHMASISQPASQPGQQWLKPTSIGRHRQVPDLIKPSGVGARCTAVVCQIQSGSGNILPRVVCAIPVSCPCPWQWNSSAAAKLSSDRNCWCLFGVLGVG